MTVPPLHIPRDVAIRALRRFIDCNHPQFANVDYVAEWTRDGITIRELPRDERKR